jgi:hypothetical protein
VMEVAQCPYAEVCWYLPITREQFRLTGVASVALLHSRTKLATHSRSCRARRPAANSGLGAPGRRLAAGACALAVRLARKRVCAADEDCVWQARQRAWRKMSAAARSQFAWPSPGIPRLEDDAAFEVSDPSVIEDDVRTAPRAAEQHRHACVRCVCCGVVC